MAIGQVPEQLQERPIDRAPMVSEIGQVDHPLARGDARRSQVDRGPMCGYFLQYIGPFSFSFSSFFLSDG
jgi:hypothetical protein